MNQPAQRVCSGMAAGVKGREAVGAGSDACKTSNANNAMETNEHKDNINMVIMSCRSHTSL